MNMLQHTVGRKILMAITGQGMVLFAIVHVLGNSSIFIGPNGINAYAEHLHSLGPLVWVFRLVMLTLLVIHVIYGIQTTLENNAAKPQGYAVKKNLRTGFAAQNMIWTGLVLLAFLVYHLLHFTARVTPDIVQAVDSAGRYDVYKMVTSSFSHGLIAFVYVAAMVALCLHLFHGIQSFFQTMGWNNECTLPFFSKLGKALAVIFLIGYSSIPVFILAGILS